MSDRKPVPVPAQQLLPPLPLGRLNALSWGQASAAVVGVCALLMLFIDHPLALALKAGVPPGLMAVGHALSTIGEASWWYLLAGGGMVVCLGAAHRARARATERLWFQRARAFVFLFAVLVSSGLVVTLLKGVIGRARPRLLFADGTTGFFPFAFASNYNAFPSGHSQVIWAAMATLALFMPRWRVGFLGVALLVSLSRILVTAHFLSDVVMGAALGLGTVLIARRFAEAGDPALGGGPLPCFLPRA
ncbi:phosphatase PAP2 family protein [Pararhodospirillum oryzae]|uniref:Phosphatase PAP2 family protein n=1 Tax=Pararhodospirillum oryzae TaxID=478448 RepID=A0A512H5S3_9PROT|nr:phosphatase PAP2 family protein [Pararhodospirillum oryzae]GEO80730.1 phosphatase PAP2 family protein [Pararhodospirillum oryzae]